MEVTADKTKYTVMPRVQNAEPSHNMKTDNSPIERVKQFKYLRTNFTKQNSLQEKIKSSLNSWNACYYSVQNILSSIC